MIATLKELKKFLSKFKNREPYFNKDYGNFSILIVSDIDNTIFLTLSNKLITINIYLKFDGEDDEIEVIPSKKVDNTQKEVEKLLNLLNENFDVIEKDIKKRILYKLFD